MALQYVTMSGGGQPPDGMVVIREHLYLTEARDRVVKEGDPAGRWLWASPGTEVSRAEALRLGAIQPEPEVAVEPEAEAAEEEGSTETEAAEEKQVKPATNKAAKRAPNKAATKGEDK